MLRSTSGGSARAERVDQFTPGTQFLKQKVFAMSSWLELLLTVIAFGGFIVVATYYKPTKNGGSC